MDVKEKLRTALLGLVKSRQVVNEAEQALNNARQVEKTARQEALRVIKASGKTEVIFENRRYWIIGAPERLCWEEFNGIAL